MGSDGNESSHLAPTLTLPNLRRGREFRCTPFNPLPREVGEG